jgi:hypothetical protein
LSQDYQESVKKRSALLFDVLSGCFAIDVKLLADGVVLATENLYPVLLGIVFLLGALHLLLSSSELFFKSVLFIVEFIFEGEEVFVERDTVSEERFIARSLILLVDLSILEQLDFGFHSGDLLLKVVDVVELELVAFGAFGLLALATLISVVVAFQI